MATHKFRNGDKAWVLTDKGRYTHVLGTWAEMTVVGHFDRSAEIPYSKQYDYTPNPKGYWVGVSYGSLTTVSRYYPNRPDRILTPELYKVKVQVPKDAEVQRQKEAAQTQEYNEKSALFELAKLIKEADYPELALAQLISSKGYGIISAVYQGAKLFMAMDEGERLRFRIKWILEKEKEAREKEEKEANDNFQQA